MSTAFKGSWLRWIGAVLLWAFAISRPESAVTNANPEVWIRTNAGSIRVELFASQAPVTVANFLAYVDAGHYKGTIFHRVISNFMIQGGGFLPDMSEKPAREPIANESRNHLHNQRGTLAMARTEDPNSAAAQFFINVRDNLRLDFDPVKRKEGYAVFGQVVEGMDVVDGISLVETRTMNGMDDVPESPIIIESIERIASSSGTH